MVDKPLATGRRARRWLRSPGSNMSPTSLLLLGLLVGLAVALIYAWIIEPVVYVEASPARLSDKYKAEYIYLVSQSYAADGNWERASKRLAALEDPEIRETVAAQLEDYLRRGEPALVLRNLASLADRLGVNNVAVAVFVPAAAATATATVTAVASTLEPTVSRPPTNTPFPSATPTSRPSPTAVPVYRLLSQERICLPNAPVARIEVLAVDPFLEPLAGAEVIVQWEEGADHFFTGFQPEKGLGYGDFSMNPDVSYSVSMAEGSVAVSGLRIESCDGNLGGHSGGWRLMFQNTDVPQDVPTP